MEADRPAIFQHIVRRFGRDRTARVAAFGTIQSKGVIDDVGRHLAMEWEKTHGDAGQNPWSLQAVAQIKAEFDEDPERTKRNYPELFYYYDGLIDTKVSQSVHPAGMVISPVPLDDNYGVFDKDGESCLMLDMDEAHEVGLAKYDFLILKTVQVIRDTCAYLNRPYPKTHEVRWDDADVWADMVKSPVGIFQFESEFSFDCLKKFQPKSVFEMSLVAACIRPSGASYRDGLLARRVHRNPSALIDDLLKDNLGYLVYQEDTIKFLQQICGLTGSEADNVRRAIGRKQKDRLDAAMPSILEGYCAKSEKPREEAEREAREFLQVIADSANYQFGYNHSIAYCLLGHLCAYFRFYHPIQFLTSFLNNAANDDDIRNGTACAAKLGIKVTLPRWGVSRSAYSFDEQRRVIAKGLASVKYMSAALAEELYRLSRARTYSSFMDLLYDLDRETSLNARQLEILIQIDFFSDFGNQRELLRMVDLFHLFKKGEAKQIRKSAVDGTPLEPIVQKYAVGVTKSGGEAKSYTLLDVMSILREAELAVRRAGMPDLNDVLKVQNFYEAMGYMGYSSGRQEDRPKLYVTKVVPLRRKKDGSQFGFSLFTKSIGSGLESRFTVLNHVYAREPVHEGDIIYCKSYARDGRYFKMNAYRKITGGGK